MLTAKLRVIAPSWNRYNGQRSMVPPARSARHGACATMAGPLAAKVALRMRCCTTLHGLARDGQRGPAISLRTGSGLGLIMPSSCSGQDLWNHAVHICFGGAVIHDAGAQRKFPPNSRVRQIHTAALDHALKNR